ncbi:MAG: PDZ domain-containing protein [Gemmataceae bacterium]|nr:PDZ domain-containing protein [Gemmataceae bacterium]
MPLSYRGLPLAAGLLAFTFALPATAQDNQDKKPDTPKPKTDPKGVQVGPPPELAALRAAVEEAAKKGENVDEIRARLEALEKALAGKAWAKPKPAPEPAPQPQRQPNPFPPAANNPFGGLVVPGGGLGGLGAFGGGGQVDPADLVRAQGLLLRAAQLAAEEPVDQAKVEALRKEAEELLAKALGAPGGMALPGLEAFGGLGALNNPNGFGGLGGFDLPPPARPRLGVTVEPADADPDAGVPAGRGVRVVEVVPGLPADKAGLKRGDVIVEFAGRAVGANSQNFVRLVQRARAGEKVDIVYVRDGKRQTAKGLTLDPPG